MHVDVNGTRLWFDVDGPAVVPDGKRMRDRPTVVLLHGGPGSFDHSYFKPDFERLAQQAQVVYLDLRDHGRSAWGKPADWSFEICADDVRAFCDVLGITQPLVYGHSLGGFIAMLYAARHPGHPGALVLQSTHGRFDLSRIVDSFRRAGGDEVAEIAASVYGGKRAVTPEEWDRCWKLFGPWLPDKARVIANRELNPPGIALMRRFDALDQLARIECPTLVCAGTLDPIMPVAASREIVECMSAGIARLEVIEGAGHFPWNDVPDCYWPMLTEFVTASTVSPGGVGAGLISRAGQSPRHAP